MAIYTCKCTCKILLLNQSVTSMQRHQHHYCPHLSHDIKVDGDAYTGGLWKARWQLLSDGTCSQFRGFLEPTDDGWT